MKDLSHTPDLDAPAAAPAPSSSRPRRALSGWRLGLRPDPIPARLLRDRLTPDGPLRLYEEGWGEFTILLVTPQGPRILVECDLYDIALQEFAREIRARDPKRCWTRDAA